MDTESWCAVERTSDQSYTRATRKHYEQNFKSTVFDKSVPAFEERTDLSASNKLDTSNLPKRKTFPEKSEVLSLLPQCPGVALCVW